MASLHLLLERERRLRDQAQAALRQAERDAQRAREQCQQLHAYRSEYEQRWSSRFVRGGSIEIVHCYRDFMLRLDQALALQRLAAEKADAQQARAQASLLECERRMASVRKLLERRAAELARFSRRREQQHSDEAAQRMLRLPLQDPLPQ